VQLNFSFINQNQEKFTEKNFILTPENSSAYKFLEKFFNQDDFDRTQFPIMIVKGEENCGKTHLLNIFAKKYNTEFINKEILNDSNPLNIFANNKFFIVDDYSQIIEEERILSLINSAIEARVFLLLADDNQRKFNLKDLNSRLKNIFATEIKNPSIETMKLLISYQLSQQQIKLSGDIIDDIISNSTRSYIAIESIIKKINFFYIESGEKISKSNISKFFNNNSKS
jgi:chromosomal replication initiation ATPase DnaA